MIKKQIKKIYSLVLAISVILIPLLTFVAIVSFMDKNLVAGIAYGVSVLVWIYASYQWLKIARELKDIDKP
ncbi:hypothetical protein ACERC8_02580 [Streptococcus sp. E29BA]|uniref:hypothetical protein n=1 Tax=Streptococcus sp. E29BA TaxID=3278716 RepID=UPI00359D14D2